MSTWILSFWAFGSRASHRHRVGSRGDTPYALYALYAPYAPYAPYALYALYAPYALYALYAPYALPKGFKGALRAELAQISMDFLSIS